MEFQEVEPPDDEKCKLPWRHFQILVNDQNNIWKTYTSRITGEGFELTATGPSTLIKGTFGKTTEPSGMEYTSTSEQSTPLR